MVKIKNPLMSGGASGSIGGVMTFSMRKSGAQVRFQNKQKRKTPSTKQAVTQAKYKAIPPKWNALTDAEKKVYNDYVIAHKLNMTGYNYYLKLQMAIPPLPPFPTNGIVSYWKLDEISGNAHDEVGGNTATNYNTTYSAGKINNGASFPGNGLLSAGDPTNLRLTTAGSISIWIKNPPGSHKSLVGKGNFNNDKNAYYIAINNANILFEISDSITANQLYGNKPTLGDGNWHQIVCVWDSQLRIYVDGVYLIGAVRTRTPNTAGYNFYIGASNWNYYTGIVDEVGVWNRALTQTEITELYNGGAGVQYHA